MEDIELGIDIDATDKYRTCFFMLESRHLKLDNNVPGKLWEHICMYTHKMYGFSLVIISINYLIITTL